MLFFLARSRTAVRTPQQDPSSSRVSATGLHGEEGEGGLVTSKTRRLPNRQRQSRGLGTRRYVILVVSVLPVTWFGMGVCSESDCRRDRPPKSLQRHRTMTAAANRPSSFFFVRDGWIFPHQFEVCLRFGVASCRRMFRTIECDWYSLSGQVVWAALQSRSEACVARSRPRRGRYSVQCFTPWSKEAAKCSIPTL